MTSAHIQGNNYYNAQYLCIIGPCTNTIVRTLLFPNAEALFLFKRVAVADDSPPRMEL